MEVGIPFYQETTGLPTSVGKPRASSSTAPGTVYKELPSNSGTVIRGLFDTVFRSIGEDFSFGFLIGAPETLTPYAATPKVPCDPNRVAKWNGQKVRAIIAAKALNPPDKAAVKAPFGIGLQQVFLDGPVPLELQALQQEYDEYIDNQWFPPANITAYIENIFAEALREFEDVCIL